MYCPFCGAKIYKPGVYCEACGESISVEESFYKKFRNKKIFSFILTLIIITIFLSLYWLYGQIYWIIVFIFLFALLFYLLQQYTMVYSGEVKSCPSCQVNVPSADFCIKCGKNLNEVVLYLSGYRLGSDIEITPEQLIVYTKRRDKNANYRRYMTEKFFISMIMNLRISKCRLPLSMVPCISFDYEGKHLKFQVSENVIDDLEDIFTSELFTGTEFYHEY